MSLIVSKTLSGSEHFNCQRAAVMWKAAHTLVYHKSLGQA